MQWDNLLPKHNNKNNKKINNKKKNIVFRNKYNISSITIIIDIHRVKTLFRETAIK